MVDESNRSGLCFSKFIPTHRQYIDRCLFVTGEISKYLLFFYGYVSAPSVQLRLKQNYVKKDFLPLDGWNLISATKYLTIRINFNKSNG